MGAHYGFGKTVNKGLVLAYDTGDTTNSYRGEPTENLVNTNSNVYTLGNTNFPIAPPVEEVFNGSTQNGMSWTDHLRWYNETIPSGTTITISGWYMVHNTDPLTPWQGSARLIIYSSAGYGGTVSNPGAWNTWNYFETTYTFPQDTTSFRLEDAGYDYHNTEDASNTTAYGCNYQVELKPHATPFVNGTRSATQGLLDLTGNSIIDLNTVSFDSNAQMTFDGTDDKAEIANFPHIWDGSLTVEAVVSWNDDSRSIILGNYNVGANDINFEKLTGRSLRFYWNRGERDITTPNNTVTTTGEYHHVVFTRGTTFRMYVNGNLITESSTDIGTDVTSTGSTFRIGGDTRDGTTVHNGDIPVVKAYSRALTAAEVKQNFNHYKTRFSI